MPQSVAEMSATPHRRRHSTSTTLLIVEHRRFL